MDVSLFDYNLPDELIARYPAEKRDASRMMIVDRATGAAQPGKFTDLSRFLAPGDLLIYNDTKVRRGRIFGRKLNLQDTPGAVFEALLLEPVNGDSSRWNAMLRPGKRAVAGTRVVLTDRNNAPTARLKEGDFLAAARAGRWAGRRN